MPETPLRSGIERRRGDRGRRRACAVVLPAALALAALAGCGGHSAAPPADTTTTGASRPIEPPLLRRAGTVSGGAIATSGTKKLEAVTEPFSVSKTDASVTIDPKPASHYTLTVTNTSPYAYLDSFVWQPTSQVTVKSVRSSTGDCVLVPGSIPNHDAVSCSSLRLVPPACACSATGIASTVGSGGGSVAVDLVLHVAAASKYVRVGTAFQRLRGLPRLGVLSISSQTLVLHTRPLGSSSHVRIVNLHG